MSVGSLIIVFSLVALPLRAEELPRRCIPRLAERVRGALTGPVWTCWPNGRWKSATVLLDGRRNGRERRWSAAGRLLSRRDYRLGLLHGEALELYDSGTKSHRVGYRFGRKHGTETLWSRAGRRVLQREYVNGRLHAEEWEWYESGAKKSLPGSGTSARPAPTSPSCAARRSSRESSSDFDGSTRWSDVSPAATLGRRSPAENQPCYAA